MSIEIIGAGFGRTGTSSLKTALEMLGFGRCYHMEEVFSHPQHTWSWLNAWQGDSVNWSRLFRGYRSTVDWPGSTFYKSLMDQYPQAKVILTVRDPEQWYESTLHTIYDVMLHFPLNGSGRFIPIVSNIANMLNGIIWEGTFKGNFEDKKFAIETYQQHNKSVMNYVPAERLLVYDVSQGWEPLCNFLNVQVPNGKSFPHRNHRLAFKRKAQLLTAGLVVGLNTAFVISGVSIWWLLSQNRHRSNR